MCNCTDWTYICTSRAYQTTTRPNETNQLDDRNFAKGTIRRMRAEVMLDCISQVTETADKQRQRINVELTAGGNGG